MSNEKIALEQAILKYAYRRQKRGLRRVPFDDVLRIPELRDQFPTHDHGGFVPDELCLSLNELREDGLLLQHDINFRQGADGHWSGTTRNNPAISITDSGKREIEPALMSDMKAMEQEVLELLRDQIIEMGNRRVPLELVRSLTTVKAQTFEANEIPDDLIRILKELKEDGYLLLHDIQITPLLGSEWAVSINRGPSLALTEKGMTYVANRTTAGSVPAKLIQKSEPDETSDHVFIVHGRDDGTKEAVARLLEKLGLKPLVLHEQANRGRTIIEKFEDYSTPAFAIALLTPDDVGGLERDRESLNPRARQNVIFEFGYLIGKIGRQKVCAIRKGDVEIPSDYDGVVYVNMDDQGNWKFRLVQELKAAGIDVDANRIV